MWNRSLTTCTSLNPSLTEKVDMNQLVDHENNYSNEKGRKYVLPKDVSSSDHILDLDHTLFLSKDSFNKKCLDRLSDTITTLSLNKCDLDDTDALNLADYLKTNTSVTEIYLSDNLFTNKGAFLLANALNINNTVKILGLYGNKIEAEGAAALAASSFSGLFLGGNPIGDAGAYAISHVLLNNVDLRGNTLASRDITKTEIYLGDCGIGDKGVYALGSLIVTYRPLSVLSIPRNPLITEKGLAVLKRAKEERKKNKLPDITIIL